MRPWAAIIGVLICLVSAEAAAQVTVGATLGQSHQNAGDRDGSYLGPGFGGTSLSGIGMIDVAIRPRLTFGGEVSLAGDISGAQSERAPGGSNMLISEHHDTVFSGLLKMGTPSTQRVRAAAVLGGGIAQRRTERTGTFVPFASSSGTEPVHEMLTNYVLAFTAGADLSIGLSDHVAILAVGRFYQLKDDDRTPSGTVQRGVSSTILRYGAGLQIRF